MPHPKRLRLLGGLLHGIMSAARKKGAVNKPVFGAYDVLSVCGHSFLSFHPQNNCVKEPPPQKRNLELRGIKEGAYSANK